MKHRRQRGAALFVALMLLLILTLSALAGMSSSILQERMVGASFQSLRAAQFAQERLAQGERRAYEFVTKIDPVPFFADCTKLTNGTDCSAVGGIRAVTRIGELLRPQLTSSQVSGLCSEGDLIAMSMLPPNRTLGQAIDEYLFQLTGSAAVCAGSTTDGALPVVVQSYYSP